MSWTDHRPMAPHLQVYRLPITAWTSIIHRATGVILYVGMVLLIMTLAAASAGGLWWDLAHLFFGSLMGHVTLVSFTFSLYYHLVNGVRHLLWDFGAGFKREQLRRAAVIVLSLSIVLTGLTWFLALN